LETGRVYALAKLAEAGEEHAIRARHGQALHALFEQAYADCWLIPEAEFVARYEAELDNLRAALDWSLQHDAEAAIALAGAAARRANQRRLALATTIGSDRDIFAAMGNLADVALIGGDAAEAVRLGRGLLERLGRRHRVTRAIALGNLLLALLALDDLGAAHA